MIVFHGTDANSAKNIIENGIDLKYGDESVDNGQGFYTTPKYEFALERAKNTAITASKFNKEDIEPAVIRIEIDIERAKCDSDINVKVFNGCTYEWKEFVMYNRLTKRFLKKWNITSDNHNLDSKYDFVIDETADSHIADIVSSIRYAKSIDSLKEIIKNVDRSNRVNWGKQLSLHTENALNFIKKIEIMNI